ncbi:MAG: hypothetical protein ACJ8HI_13735 [Massilia sp.]|jgi:hypothetical protein
MSQAAITTGIFDSSGEIELTGEARVHVIQNGRLLFAGEPAELLPSEGEGDPTVVLLRPCASANQKLAPAWTNGVYVRADAFRFHNGSGWMADIS